MAEGIVRGGGAAEELKVEVGKVRVVPESSVEEAE